MRFLNRNYGNTKPIGVNFGLIFYFIFLTFVSFLGINNKFVPFLFPLQISFLKTNITTLALADYYCPDINPSFAKRDYFATHAYEYVGPDCLFSGLDDPTLTALKVYVPYMAIDAFNTLDQRSLIDVNGAKFYLYAQILVYGFSSSLPGFEDGTFENTKFTFILRNSIIQHQVLSDFFAAVSFAGRFPLGSNITIFNNSIELGLKVFFQEVSEDMLTAMYNLIWFQLDLGLSGRSVLVIEQNIIKVQVTSDGEFQFDSASYKQLIKARHEYAESTGTPLEQGQWTLQGDEYLRYASIITFAIYELKLGDNSHIIVASNNITYGVVFGIVDAEIVTMVSNAICFQKPVVLDNSSHFVIHKNLASLSSSLFVDQVHQQSELSSTFIDFIAYVEILNGSSLQITQNFVEQISITASSFAIDAYDDRLSHSQGIRVHTVIFGMRTLLSDTATVLLALNTLRTSVTTQVLPTDDNISTTAVAFATVLHRLPLSVSQRSLYHIHGTRGFAAHISIPNARTRTTTHFADFDDGVIIYDLSQVIIGCVNPFHHPDPVVRRERPIRDSYSDAYEESVTTERAAQWNGPLIGTNATRFNFAVKEEEERGLNIDPTALWWDDRFFGKRRWNYITVPRDKCYSNAVQITGKHQTETSATLLLSFVYVWGRTFIVANNSAFTVSNNWVPLTSSSTNTGTFLFFILITVMGNGFLDARNYVYNGQVVVAGHFNAVPSSRYNMDSDYYLHGVSREVESSEVSFDPYVRSAIIITDNDISREWTETIGFGQSVLTLISAFGAWITQNSSILVRNNFLSMLASPPSFFFRPNASRIRRNMSTNAIILSSNPKSPNYDPFLLYKNISTGVSSVIAFDNTFLANPHMILKFIGNSFAYFNHLSAVSTADNPMQVLPFDGYELPAGPHRVNTSAHLIPPNFELIWGQDFTDYFAQNTFDEEGLPTTFLPRFGPPIYRVINWDTWNERKERVQDHWQGRNVTREETDRGIVIIFKNETTPNSPPNPAKGDRVQIVPWTNDWTVYTCGGLTNNVPVSYYELSSGMMNMLNFRGLPLNPGRGEHYVKEHGIGLQYRHCEMPVMNPTNTPSMTHRTHHTHTTSSSLYVSRSFGIEASSTYVTTLTMTKEIPPRPATGGTIDATIGNALKTSSDVVGGVVASIGTTLSSSTSVQVSIGNALLRMASCSSAGVDDNDDNSSDSLPILVHPLRFSIMSSEAFHQERGAVVGNLAIAAATIAFVRFTVVYAVGRFMNTGEDASVIVGWPSAAVLPFVSLGEGTASSATALLRRVASTHTDNAFGNETASTGGDPESSALLSVTALNATLGIVGLCVLVGVGVWWTYCLVKTIPRAQLALTRRRHNGSRLAWFVSPLYTFEYRSGSAPPTSRSGETREEGSENAHKDDLGESFASLVTDDAVAANGPATNEPTPLSADEQAARAESAMTVLERHGHMLGDRVYLCVDLLCFVAAVVVGVSEGLGDDGVQCQARITVAALAALAQVFLNALSTIPLDLLIQLLLGLVTAALALMAVVRVYASGSVGIGLASTMDAVATFGNLLGLAAMAMEVVAVGLRLFRARRQRQARAMERLRRYMSGSAAVVGAGDASDLEELSLVRHDIDGLILAKSKGRVGHVSTANLAFQINVDFGDDLDLFLLDVEEEAMRVDELEISLDEVDANYVPVETLGEPEIELE